MNSAELMRYRQAELQELYAQLPAPERGSADGVWRGKLMAFSGLGWLPRWLAAALYRLLALPINPWRGKGFDGDEGANRWFGMPGVGYAFYNLKFIDSPLDGRPAVCLDYDRKDNLALASPHPRRRARAGRRRDAVPDVLADPVRLAPGPVLHADPGGLRR